MLIWPIWGWLPWGRCIPFFCWGCAISLDNSWCITDGQRMHNSCCACAYQLLCKRTTAVVRPKILTVSTTYPISSSNLSYLFQQLILSLPATDSISFNNMTYLFQQHDLYLPTTRFVVDDATGFAATVHSEDGCWYGIARILLCRIELDDKKETLQSLRSERRQKIVRERLDEWCAAKGYRDTSLNMITLSRSLDISRYELSRYLSSCLDTTFRPWLAEVRFEAAKKMMLDNPDFGNDIISAECGFSSRTHLYRMFKEKEGCSPTAWREKNC